MTTTTHTTAAVLYREPSTRGDEFLAGRPDVSFDEWWAATYGRYENYLNNPVIREPARAAWEAGQKEAANRRPTAYWRTVLREYLKRGPAARKAILRDTEIPPGSLSALLMEDGIERCEEIGMWRLTAV